MAATVTIDKAYFETILRRAEFHVSGRDITTPVDLPVVTIPKVDHDNLLRMAQEYIIESEKPIKANTSKASLRDALCKGGIAPETLEILIRGDANTLSPTDTGQQPEDTSNGISRWDCNGTRPGRTSTPSNSAFTKHTKNGWGIKNHLGPDLGKDKAATSYHRHYSFGPDDNSFPSDVEKDDQYLSASKVQRQRYARDEQRSILLKNLSERTTHKDLTNIIRGGAILDIFLRSSEKVASISFVEGTAAHEFMTYAKRNDIYVHGKRIELAWNDRQFILPGHVANKIGIGATRNLVIRGVHPKITADRLRADLDHIHNLVIVDISFHSGNAYVSLNSVHNCLFARTCMMSRIVYKGMKIEWLPDECAQPLPKTHHALKEENSQLFMKKDPSINNRFQMLNIDGTEDGSQDDQDEDLTGFSLTKYTSSRVPWSVTA